jgi:hypothetical protein
LLCARTPRDKGRSAGGAQISMRSLLILDC